MEESKEYYVYAHYRLDNFTPFYIGKGKGRRAYRTKRNKHHDRIVEKHGYAVIILYDCLSEEEAFELERATIEYLVFVEGYGINIKGFAQYEDNYLTNTTWGGEGVSGYTFDKETIVEHAKFMKEYYNNEENRERVSLASKKLWEDEEYRDKQQKARQQAWSQEQRDKQRDILKDYYSKQENKDKLKERSIYLKKPIYCIELNKIWVGIGDCGKELGLNRSNLATCCRGETRTVNGYHFIYVSEDIINFNNINKSPMCESEINLLIFYEAKNNKKFNPIYCKEMGEIRLTASKWVKELGVDASNITNCCKGKIKQAKGYHFSYATEEQIKEYEQQLLSQLPEGCFLKTFPEYIDLYKNCDKE